jgi:hypothetical protein
MPLGDAVRVGSCTFEYHCGCKHDLNIYPAVEEQNSGKEHRLTFMLFEPQFHRCSRLCPFRKPSAIMGNCFFSNCGFMACGCSFFQIQEAEPVWRRCEGENCFSATFPRKFTGSIDAWLDLKTIVPETPTAITSFAFEFR